MFLLLHFSVTYIGAMFFTSMWRIQYRILEEPMYYGAFPLSFAHLEFLGLIVMAWKTLKRQVEQRTHPGHSVNVEKNFASKIAEKMFQSKNCHCLEFL